MNPNVRRVQELRRCNAARPIPGKKANRPPRKPKHPKREAD